MRSVSWVSLLLAALVLYVLAVVLNVGLLYTLAVIAAVVGVVLLVVDLATPGGRVRR